mmetsp:Transcript_36498/g.53509  ORF Transcript_36498/g.53509 Transcript_36498/m.53509 type:complete len:260 (-) Transcript_36498:423-1202(-)
MAVTVVQKQLFAILTLALFRLITIFERRELEVPGFKSKQRSRCHERTLRNDSCRECTPTSCGYARRSKHKIIHTLTILFQPLQRTDHFRVVLDPGSNVSHTLRLVKCPRKKLLYVTIGNDILNQYVPSLLLRFIVKKIRKSGSESLKVCENLIGLFILGTSNGAGLLRVLLLCLGPILAKVGEKLRPRRNGPGASRIHAKKLADGTRSGILIAIERSHVGSFVIGFGPVAIENIEAIPIHIHDTGVVRPRHPNPGYDSR